MIRVDLLLPIAALIAACSPSEPEQPLCTFDDQGRIVMQSAMLRPPASSLRRSRRGPRRS